MELPGGPSDKAGNRYEFAWTVACVLEVYQERANRIRIEHPGTDETGAEFVLYRNKVTEFHQCKIGPSGLEKWNLNRLHTEGVLLQWLRFSQSDSSEFHFVTTVGVEGLTVLSSRAKKAIDFDEFKRDFLRAHTWSAAFTKLCELIKNDDILGRFAPSFSVRATNLDDEAKTSEEIVKGESTLSSNVDDEFSFFVYEKLRRMKIRTIDEDTLRNQIENNLKLIFSAVPSTSYAILQDLVLNSINAELVSTRISSFFSDAEIQPTDPGRSTLIHQRVGELNEMMWTRLKGMTINGINYPRSETTSTLTKIQAKDQRIVLVTGEAGVGKSGVVLNTARELCNAGWAVLGFRADDSSLESISLKNQVSTAYSLPDQSPAAILDSISANCPALLVIDQLDAVSITYGRRMDLFNVLKLVIDDALGRGIKVLLGCRKFDIENDHRLRQLSARNDCVQIQVHGFKEEEVRGIVSTMGGDGNKLSSAQISIFSVPLHLSMLETCGTSGIITILSEKDLFDQFWKEKRKSTQNRRQRLDWNNIIDRMLIEMNKSASLTAPLIALSDCDEDDTNALISENVILKEPNGYRFLHEKFLDYAFARRFSEKRLSLQELVLSAEQSLSLRSRIRQILLYRRSADFSQYLIDNDWLLTNNDVRFHIKALVFNLLAQLAEPNADEWKIVRRHMVDDNGNLLLATPVEKFAWKLPYLQPWFKQAYSYHDIEKWLKSTDSETVDNAVLLLSWIDFALPDELVETLATLIQSSSEWRSRVIQLFSGWTIPHTRALFDLYLSVLHDGLLDGYYDANSNQRDFWSYIYKLVDSNPVWACEAIAAYLRRGLKISEIQGIETPLKDHDDVFSDSQMDGSALEKCAKVAPHSVIDYLLPVVEEVILKTANSSGSLPWIDPVWVYRHNGEIFSLAGHLLHVVENSMAFLAKSDPSKARRIIASLDPQYETNQYLIVRTYTAAGAELADDAVDFLSSEQYRLETGYIDDHQYATRLLIEAITPYCTEARLIRLEKVILNYYPDWEKSSRGNCRGNYRGRSQLKLIEGIVNERRSKAVSKRIAELRRKFAEWLPQPPKRLEVQQVMSPVPEKSADKLSDEQWISAINTYNVEERGWHKERYGSPIGGAIQLSRQLQAQIKSNPERFVQLANRLSDEVNEYYFDGILNGIAEANATLDILVSLIERCHRLPARPCGKAICRLIHKKSELGWPDSILDILSWYALHDPDPDKELWRTLAGSSKQPYYGGSIINAGINCTRGVAAEAIAQLLFSHKEFYDLLLPVVYQMVDDPSIAVRSLVALPIGYVWNVDRSKAIELMYRLCETEDVLLGTHYVQGLFPYMLHTHSDQLKPLLKRMIASKDHEIQETGATMAVIAYLSHDSEYDLVEICYSGTPSHRKGLAEAFSTNVGRAELRKKCTDKLCKLFNDGDSDVRKAAGSCFTRFKGEELGEVEHLVQAYAESKSLIDDCSHIMRALEETTAMIPETSLQIYERFVELYNESVGDIRLRSLHEAGTVSKLVLRLYSQTDDVLIQKRCLNLIDKLIEYQVHGLDRDIDEYESR